MNSKYSDLDNILYVVFVRSNHLHVCEIIRFRCKKKKNSVINSKYYFLQASNFPTYLMR